MSNRCIAVFRTSISCIFDNFYLHTHMGGVVNLYKNQGNLHIHYYGKKDIQITAEINYTNNHGCQDIQLGK